MSFFSKVTLTVTAWSGAAGRVDSVVLQQDPEPSDQTEEDDQMALYAGFGSVLIVDFILAGIMWYDIRKYWKKEAAEEPSSSPLDEVQQPGQVREQPSTGVRGAFPNTKLPPKCNRIYDCFQTYLVE